MTKMKRLLNSLNPDTYHEGAVQEITFYQLAYCKISGCYNRLTYRAKDYWRHEILHLPRPAPMQMEEVERMIAKLAASILSDSMLFYEGAQWSKGDQITIRKPDRYIPLVQPE